MKKYLISLMYHYPQDYELWKKGRIEDYESSTGLFVNAKTEKEAIKWSRVVATNLLNYVNGTTNLTMEQFQHSCRLIQQPENSSWSHCLGFFQTVCVGEIPPLEKLTTDSYALWLEKKNT